MYKIYKNLMTDFDREQILSVIKLFPENCWTQSVCTDEQVLQLREFLPRIVIKKLYKIHDFMIKQIEEDFDLESKNISLNKPDYRDLLNDGILTVDKRIVGMSLSAHADIPTGTFEKHLGTTDGTSPITMSAIFYWNDDFSGGEINFHEKTSPEELFKESKIENLPITGSYKPIAGDLLVFPSSTIHSITPVESGERYSTQYFYNKIENKK